MSLICEAFGTGYVCCHKNPLDMKHTMAASTRRTDRHSPLGKHAEVEFVGDMKYGTRGEKAHRHHDIHRSLPLAGHVYGVAVLEVVKDEPDQSFHCGKTVLVKELLIHSSW